MEKKKLKKLSLKKDVIASLNHDEMLKVEGGITYTVSDDCGTADCFTQGDCDLNTIGHDDGPNCLSKTDWGWCWCYGQ